MDEIYDDKYWIDYTNFIKSVERTTGLSPNDLLNRYEELISELKEYEIEGNFKEWQFEFDYDSNIRKEIQKVFMTSELLHNLLLKPFQNKVELLDSQYKMYLLNGNEENWWLVPKIKFIN